MRLRISEISDSAARDRGDQAAEDRATSGTAELDPQWTQMVLSLVAEADGQGVPRARVYRFSVLHGCTIELLFLLARQIQPSSIYVQPERPCYISIGLRSARILREFALCN